MPADPSPELPKPIFVVSDSTGDTAAATVRAALAQFQAFLVHVSTYAHVTDERRIEALVRLAHKEGAIIVFTLVNADFREHLRRRCDAADVACIDLIGPLLQKLHGHLGGDPASGIPGRRTPLNDDYFRRIEAVEFTVKHDDGAEPRHLRKSDVVLVGVSRTSKTPLSTYLAQKGLKVANIPIVLGIDPPREMYEIDQERLFGLTIEAETLHAIRMARISNLGLAANSNYGSIEHIYMELDYAHEIFRGNPTWPVIDVTHRAIEETAAVIIKMLDERKRTSRRGATLRG